MNKLINKPSTKYRLPSTNPAFTIVELLVVIVVIGILAAITIVAYTGISSKATVASLVSDLDNASKQLKLYQVEYDSFPATMNSSNCPTAPVNDPKYCIKTSNGNTYTYTPGSGSKPQAFSLVAKNNNTYYHLTNSTQPIAVTPITEVSVSATGTYTLSSDGPYRIYKFTGSGSITTTIPGTAEVLVVGGGGGGAAGGGGAGGYLTGAETLTGTMTVTVGNGGLAGANGGNSIFGTRTATGGGAGGLGGVDGSPGGSGGGGGYDWQFADQLGGLANGTPINQGNAGGNSSAVNTPDFPSGGGGGAGAIGGTYLNQNTGGLGGAGISNDIVLRGTIVGYAGGGGGSCYREAGTGGSASNGGGAGGTKVAGVRSVIGTTNTGGGGGGGSTANLGAYDGGAAGGSGIVIIRYLTP